MFDRTSQATFTYFYIVYIQVRRLNYKGRWKRQTPNLKYQLKAKLRNCRDWRFQTDIFIEFIFCCCFVLMLIGWSSNTLNFVSFILG